MKIKYFFSVLFTTLLFINVNKLNAQAPTVSISASPTTTLTCAVPQITLTGYCSTSGTASPTFTWNGPGIMGSNTNSTCVLNLPSVYTVIATDPNTNLTNTATITIYQDFFVNTASVSPGNQVIQCSLVPITYTGSPTTFTNNTYKWYLPGGGAILNGYTVSPGCAGTYTFEITNTLNGCKSLKTVTVSVNTCVPLMTISAQNNNFDVSCTTCPTLYISAVVSGTCSGGTGAQFWNSTGTSTLSVNSLTTCSANNYIAYAYSFTAPNCSVTQMFSVNSNTAISSITVAGTPTVCPGNSVTLTASGANTYTWSTGSNAPSITVSPTTTTNYTVMGTNNGADCQTIQTVSLGPVPNVTVTGNTALCYSTSVTFTASGATTYSWNTGPTTNTLYVMPLVSTNYYLTGSASGSCTVTKTIVVAVNNACSDVWPGDANSDGAANNLDVLEVGLQFATSGQPRTTQNNIWSAHPATNWTGVLSTGKNRVHADCNGDGQVDNLDTTAISLNYGSNHAFKAAASTSTVNNDLYLIHDMNYMAPGAWGASSIYLGDASSNQMTVYGFCFDLGFDAQYVVTDSIWLEYPTSFFDGGLSYINYKKNNFANAVLHAAVTRTDHTDLFGGGLVARVHYKIKPSLPDVYFHIGFSNCKKSVSTAVISPLTCGLDSVVLSQSYVGIKENTKAASVTLFPNPAQNAVSIKSDKVITNIIIKDMTGRNVLEKNVAASNFQYIELKNLANGVYHVSVYSNDKVIKQEKLVVGR